MSLTGGIRPYDTFSYFELHCRAKRYTKLSMIMSHTCANCCGITYAAHFEHPEQCPAFTGCCRAVVHDDRVDAVAGAVAHFQRTMMMDTDQAAKAMRDEEMQQEIEDFIEGFNQPTYRGMRVNGVRVATWSSQHGWSGM